MKATIRGGNIIRSHKFITFENEFRGRVLQRHHSDSPGQERIFYYDPQGEYQIDNVPASLAIVEILDEAKGLYKVIRSVWDDVEDVVEKSKQAVEEVKGFWGTIKQLFKGLFRKRQKQTLNVY